MNSFSNINNTNNDIEKMKIEEEDNKDKNIINSEIQKTTINRNELTKNIFQWKV